MFVLCVVFSLCSLQDVSLDADIPLSQVLQFASHLVHWGKAMTIYPLSESNIYIASPTAETRASVRTECWLASQGFDHEHKQTIFGSKHHPLVFVL